MLKKTITYKDFDGNTRTEDFYFNLTKAECMELELSTNGGMQKMVEQIISEQDHRRIVEIFKTMILKAYGEKSLDGKHFRKSKEISDDFASTEAYSELFMELASDADAASQFITGILPVAMTENPEAQAKLADIKNRMPAPATVG